ncbi:MAG TPA: cytochrome c oxidase subunit II [Verrucomicrobiae bacterium]|jgi:cytochrome c oxidase subunit 2|nr:cytochrome c oxidase subunit II [Verrucomicrobiae bacterium]
MQSNLPLFPQQASTVAAQVDWLYLFLVAITAFFSLLVAALILFFIVKYRKTPGREAEQIHGSTLLEIVWTVIPLGLSMAIFVWAAIIYFHLQRPPANALEVYGVAKQWMWKFEQSGGQREINALHVPVGRPVKITLISQDVIHSFFVPAFRVKQDVLPNRYTIVWFQATEPGAYHLFCTQYCGTKHSAMIGEVVAMKPEDFEAWLTSGKAEGSLAAQGEKEFQQLGCVTCHRADSGARGPNLMGLYGRPVRLTDGRTVVADDNYIRESILVPNAKVVSGFQPIMPTFQGMISEEELIQLTDYIKHMGEQQGEPLNNRSTPTQIRDSEVTHIQERMKQESKEPQKPGKKK